MPCHLCTFGLNVLGFQAALLPMTQLLIDEARDVCTLTIRASLYVIKQAHLRCMPSDPAILLGQPSVPPGFRGPQGPAHPQASSASSPQPAWKGPASYCGRGDASPRRCFLLCQRYPCSVLRGPLVRSRPPTQFYSSVVKAQFNSSWEPLLVSSF